MYQALYRKYRPSDFSDVVGQDHVTSTLKGELSLGKIFHAYLFTGTRGTGKTSCAKILAKAVNCEHLNNGDPCGECESCKTISAGEVMDIVEIDAASNNGVDDVRILREQANFTPASAKYRVFIIDEVHMLSKQAFNALLKTLEEPPAHVVFILATTEVQELPATILSRCQRFDFTRIDAAVIKQRLLYVAENEGMDLEEGAASLIAALSDGCMRDALSLLDLCAGSGTKITEQAVESACKMTGRSHINQLIDFISQNDSASALELTSKLYSLSVDTKRLCYDLISQFRDLMIIKSTKNAGSLVVCSDVQQKTLNAQAEAFTLSDIMANLDVLQGCMQRIKGTTARCELEMAVVKMCTPQLKGDIASLEARVSALESGTVDYVKKSAPIPKPPVVKPKQEVEAVPVEDMLPPEPLDEVSNEPTAPQGEFSWSLVLAQLMKTVPLMAGMLAGSSAVLAGDKIEINAQNEGFWSLMSGDSINKKRFDDAVANVCGKRLIAVRAKAQQQTDVDPLAAFGERLKGLSFDD